VHQGSRGRDVAGAGQMVGAGGVLAGEGKGPWRGAPGVKAGRTTTKASNYLPFRLATPIIYIIGVLFDHSHFVGRLRRCWWGLAGAGRLSLGAFGTFKDDRDPLHSLDGFFLNAYRLGQGNPGI